MSSTLLGILLIFGGGLSVVGAAMDLNWFMSNRRARLIVSLFGRRGARIFYVLFGVLLILIGVGTLLGAGAS